ncbi:hypothetical protein FQU75_16395 [Paenibacillus polymyxa]|nr:hypothetical protein FQU75_16395 [Paenibacillus polymyxa]
MNRIISNGNEELQSVNFIMKKTVKKGSIHIFMSREYRTIENMYPKRSMSKVVNTSIEELSYGHFDEIKEIAKK